LRLYLPLVLLVIAGAVFFWQYEIDHEMTHLQSQETLGVGLGKGVLLYDIDGITRDLQFLVGQRSLQTAINLPTPQNLADLATDFANFSRNQGIFDKVRWLDETGMEMVRVEYLQGGSVVVPADKLQNKRDRYYFADSFKLNPGEIFISPLDLSIEQDKIEVPYKPVIRVATPVVDRQGKKRGVVILNYFASVMLEAFATRTASIADHVMVVNAEGYWLKSPNPQDEWGFMFKRPELSLAARAPAAWDLIRSADVGQVQLADGLWTWQSVYPLRMGQKSSTGRDVETMRYVWKSVAHLPKHSLVAVWQHIWLKIAAVAALLLSLLGYGSWKLVRAWAVQAAAEQEAHRAAFNDALLQTLPVGIEIVDEQGCILFTNATMERAVAQTAVGQQCWRLYKDDQQQCADCPLHQPIQVGETSMLESTGVLGARTFEINHTGMIYQGKKALLEVFYDITERKLAEEELKRRNETLERINRVTTDRELRMIELKQQVNQLSRQLGQPAPYALAFLVKDRQTSADTDPSKSNFPTAVNKP